MAQHNIIGQRGEEIAANLMRQKGFRITDVNWTCGHLEMDIIAVNQTYIAFIEVKTRTGKYADKRPEEYVDSLKQRRMTAAANAYMKLHQVTLQPRFDIIGIRLNTDLEVLELTHLEDAFQPPTKTIHPHSYDGTNRWHHRRRIIK